MIYTLFNFVGLGTVLMIPPAMVALSQYFKKRYALANGIVVLGSNTGQIVFPPLFRLLIAHYGWRGTMLIVGAIQLNGVAACALFRPLKTTTIKVKLDLEVNQTAVTPPKPITSVIQKDARPNEGNTWLRNLQFLDIFSDLSAMLMLATAALYSIGWITNLTHLPARAKEGGWSDDQGAMLLISFGIVSMLTRATHGWFVDRNYVSAYKLHWIVLLGASIVTFLNPVSDNYVFLVGYTILVGAFVGIGGPLLIVNLRSLVHPSHVPASLSLIFAVFFLFNGIGTVVAGKINFTHICVAICCYIHQYLIFI